MKMNVLRVMLRYVGYYILIMALISMFAGASVRESLITLCGGALSVSMFAAVAQLLLNGRCGSMAQRVSAWCLRGTVITTAIVVITGLGLGNIAKLFTAG